MTRCAPAARRRSGLLTPTARREGRRPRGNGETVPRAALRNAWSASPTAPRRSCRRRSGENYADVSRGKESSAKSRYHVLAEATHRVDDGRVRQVTVAHLTQHVMNARIAELAETVRDMLGGAAERGGLERVAHTVLVRHPRIVPRVDPRRLDVEVGGVVGFAR